jgi:outer membrane lipoprotein-sorting protein
MKVKSVLGTLWGVVLLVSVVAGFGWVAKAQTAPLDEQAVIRGVDAAVKARLDAILSYKATEHYRVFRGGDEAHPAAEMTVRTTYQKESGKEYAIVSRSGSAAIQKFVLDSILENEKHINEPGVREGAWMTSDNYVMKLKPGGTQQMDGRECYVLQVTPKHPGPSLIEGTLWVDAGDQSIVKIEGATSKSVSIFAGASQVMRQYAKVEGFSEATHAHAVTGSFLFGPTVITIDYSDYEMKIRATK